MSRIRHILLPVLIVLVVAGLVASAARRPLQQSPVPDTPPATDLKEAVSRVDNFLTASWQAADVRPADPADDLQVLRRLSLALHGTIPSLEEIRQFESDASDDRLERWTTRLLADKRFADYFAERLARALVGVDEGQLIVYRRDRFVSWLSEQLRSNRPFDELARDLISEHGLWTGNPAVNFVTAAAVEGDVDENKLAGRVARVFLGQRIDCAQCHDHPFADWRQADFEGLAAHFGQAKLSVVGVEDDARRQYEIEDRETLKKRPVGAKVPFNEDWRPDGSTQRAQLAAWVTHPENRRFERAIANRAWALLFGRPYVHPVDDLPDPPNRKEDLLDILGRDFRMHGYDLRRLIQVIAASQPFRLSSTHAEGADDDAFAQLEGEWAVFPLSRLRPEQIIGAMLQASSIRTIDQNSHLVTRAVRFFQERDFVREYGDLGEEELEEHAGTVPQALLRLNGRFARERSQASPFNSTGRIAAMAAAEPDALETCYLVCLSRRPTPEEQAHFLPQLKTTAKEERAKALEDVFWTLFNSPEFAWNH